MDRYERLEATVKRFDEIEAELAHPGEYDQSRVTALARERAALEETVETYRKWKAAREAIEANSALMRESDDAELRALAEDEDRVLRERERAYDQQLQALLVPKDPNDEKDVFIEVRAGAGGDEASIFAADLARMYMRYAESQKMKTETVSMSESESGGYKEIVFAVKGNAPYKDFKHESGVHRVQRVPVTEAAGRVHTSTATVAVLPIVEEDTAGVEINAKDLEIDTFKASGAGGQHVNKTESAVRITHVPTGIVVACSEERSQLQNRDRAMQMLRSVLYDRKRREAEEAVGSMRRSQVGTGDRSEKIRTYNFPQDRITDHRVNQNFGNLRGVMDGTLGHIIEELQKDERARLLAGEDGAA